MKGQFTIIFTLLIFLGLHAFSQKIKLKPDTNTMTVTDSLTNILYVVDSTRSFITAYNSRGDSLWRTESVGSIFHDHIYFPISSIEISDFACSYFKKVRSLVIHEGHCCLSFKLNDGKVNGFNCD